MANAAVSPKLTRLSRIMAWLSLAGAIVYLLLDAGTFLAPDTLNAVGVFEAHHLGHLVSSTIPFGSALLPWT
jgi:hypothetical protein